MTSILETEPYSFEEAVTKQVWYDAMAKEYNSIIKNDLWDIVPRPIGKSVIDSKWLYKIKHTVDRNTEKYKDRFVAKWFSQKGRVDQDFCSNFQVYSIRTIISLASCFGRSSHKMDVNTAFLNGVYERDVHKYAET
jgi:hypothetical protein